MSLRAVPFRRVAALVSLTVCACGRGAARYEGTVTYKTSPDTSRSLHITALNWTDSSFGGMVEIGAPSGAGSAYGWFPNDTLNIVSLSPQGDTLVWKGTPQGPTLGGTYKVIGGPSLGAAGVWKAQLVAGRAITAKNLSATDSSDVGWTEILTVLGGIAVLALLSLRWMLQVPSTPTSPPPASSLAPALYGVGGWMLWFLIGQGVTVLFMLARLPELWSPDTQASWSIGTLLPGLRPLLTIEAAMHLGQIGLPVVGIVLTVQHRSRTPRFWVLYLLFLGAYGVIDVIGAELIQARSQELFGNPQLGGEEGDVGQAITMNTRMVMWAMIWSLYWIRSIRVKQTFGLTALERVPG